MERLGNESSWKRTLRVSSVQEETKGCLDRLNEAFRMYMVRVDSWTPSDIALNRGAVSILVSCGYQVDEDPESDGGHVSEHGHYITCGS